MRLTGQAQGQRLDHAVRDQIGGSVSVREVRRALEDGRILIDGKKCAPGDRAKGGESVELLDFVPRQQAVVVAEPELLASIQVLYEDPTLLALAKPSGVPTGPLRATERASLLGAAIAHTPQIRDAGPPLEGGLVHRLDTGTSGVVLFAKDLATRSLLRTAFGQHRVLKHYRALVQGTLVAQTLVGRIGPGSLPDRVRVLDPDDDAGQPASTEVSILARYTRHSWVLAQTRTGRRHQIRAQLADAGAPIVGDAIYGRIEGDDPLHRLGLHAALVQLPDGRRIEAPDPADLIAALRVLS